MQSLKFLPFIFSLSLLFFSCKKEAGPKGDTGSQGEPGTNGTDGYTSLIKITPFGANETCINGGLIIESGIDKNKNNVLDSTEIDQTQDVCNGSDGSSDKQVFLPIPGAGSNTTSQTPVITGSLIKFNKNYYVGVDSILFVANPYVADVSNSSVVELYNITDNQPIAGSQLSSNNLFDPNGFIQSGNIYNNLPEKEITLGIEQYSTKEGFFAASGSCYLFLYRH